MTISFLRIDDRIIHGQIVIRWSREFPCDGILAVNDHAATDELLRSALKAACDKRTLIYTTEQFLTKAPDAIASKQRYFLITKDPLTMATILSQPGFRAEVTTVNVGPQSARPGAVTLNNNAAATPEELTAYRTLADLGWEIEFKLTPDAKGVRWAELPANLKGGVSA